jgi:uncharacterized membrane protein YccC
MTAASPTLAKAGGAALAEWLRDATPAFLFALRLWASVCVSFYVAFALELDEPSWAATTAALVCQPVLGASLRKSSFRLIGTVIGAIGIVIIAALVRQDRIGFLVGLALWCAASAFIATLLRNFAAYAVALAGYTAAILASDVLGPVGASDTNSVLILAIDRALEIGVGIVSAGVVLALTDLGHSRRKLAAEFAAVTTAIMDGFDNCFVIASSSVEEFRALRRDLLRRVIALDPTIDAAIGEASDLRYRSAVLQRAVSGLFETLSAWRKAAFEIAASGNPAAGRDARAVHAGLPRDRLSPDAPGGAHEPAELRAACCAAARSLTRSKTETPSQRLLADTAAEGMLGLARALNGLCGVVGPSEMIPVKGAARLRVADWLPPSINALRVFLAVNAMSLFWIASAWPSGALAITFCAVIVVLLSLQGDLAYAASITFFWGCVFGAGVAAILDFAILPRATAFPTLCLALGLALVPLGFLLARAKNPLFWFAASVNFIPMVSITNGITYDAAAFWNSALGILGGCLFGAIAMLILPPLSPAIRTSRLLALALADLRRLAKRREPPRRVDDWTSLGEARLLALPNEAEPVERAELVAAIAVGKEIVRLRRLAPQFVPGRAVDAALEALADGRSAEASERLKDIDRLIVALPGAQAPSRILLRLRAGILVICGQLAEFGPYFDGKVTLR